LFLKGILQESAVGREGELTESKYWAEVGAMLQTKETSSVAAEHICG